MKENIFRYSIKELELSEIGINQKNEKEYINSISERQRIYDLYTLFKLRKDKNASEYLWLYSILSIL